MRTLGFLAVGMLLAFGFGFVISDFSLGDAIITGFVVAGNDLSGNYTWTRAICDDQNRCLDITIKCLDGDVVSAEVISSVREFSEDWVDPRGDFAKEYCLG
jgi:hypothetical protein